MAEVDPPVKFYVRDFLRDCDANSLLRGAGLRLNEELSRLEANALSAQETIDGLMLAAGDDCSSAGLSQYAELMVQLRTVASSKKVAIEAELVQIDAALELAEELSHVNETPPPRDCVGSGASVSEERVSSLVRIIDTLKYGEALGADSNSILFVRVLGKGASGTSSVTLVTRHVSACDVELCGLSSRSRPIVGRTLRFEIRYLPSSLTTSGLDPVVSSNAELAAYTRVFVPGAAAVHVRPLPAEGDGVAVVVSVPASASVCDVLEITRVSVGRSMLRNTPPGVSLPLRLPIVPAVGLALESEIPGALCGVISNPCTTADGELYLPVGSILRVEGPRQSSFDLMSTFGVESSHAVALDDSSRTLVLGACSSPCVSAFDADTHALRWRSPSELEGTCRGIAILPLSGVCIATLQEGHVYAIRLSDGAILASLAVDYPIYAASDPINDTVYISTNYAVEAFHWDGSALLPGGLVPASVSKYNRPLAVVPRGPCNHHSHLVVGACNSLQLDVFRLPGCEHVCTTQLDGSDGLLYGLAADMTGTTLVALVTRNNAALLLPWPLVGMPSLI